MRLDECGAVPTLPFPFSTCKEGGMVHMRLYDRWIRGCAFKPGRIAPSRDENPIAALPRFLRRTLGGDTSLWVLWFTHVVTTHIMKNMLMNGEVCSSTIEGYC